MNNFSLVSMYVGETGTGKTHNMCTYPKLAIISTEPNHTWTWKLKPELDKNVVIQEYFIPTKDSLKDLFVNISKQIELYKKMQEEGKVETLGIDNFTYLLFNRWIWMNEFQRILSPKTGELDTRSMYGVLRTWAYKFVVFEVMTFKGNIVLNVHEMLESEEALEKKVDKNMDKVPNILGGFRNDIGGLFSNILFLSKLEDKTRKGGYKYLCRTNKGGGKNAKNRFNLPMIIEDVSYAAIMKQVNESLKVKEVVK